MKQDKFNLAVLVFMWIIGAACVGCVAPFTLLEETEPEEIGATKAAPPERVAYPLSSAAVPVPRRTRPGQGRSR